MPRKRTCFASSVCCSDAFIDLPAEAQALYLQLGFSADADGAVSGIRKELRAAGFGSDALDALYRGGFLIEADGVPFIAHWWVSNLKNARDYRPGDYANLVGTAIDLGEDRIYRVSNGRTLDVQGAYNVNPIQCNVNEANQREGKEREGRAPALTAPCPSCGAACAAYPDPLGSLVSFCPEHGDFTITAEGGVL